MGGDSAPLPDEEGEKCIKFPCKKIQSSFFLFENYSNHSLHCLLVGPTSQVHLSYKLSGCLVAYL